MWEKPFLQKKKVKKIYRIWLNTKNHMWDKQKIKTQYLVARCETALQKPCKAAFFGIF